MESPTMFSNALSWCLEQSKDEYTKPVLILSILIGIITWWKLSRKDVPAMPPGPWGLPLVGNLPFLNSNLHICFAKLSHKYGPIMKVKLGSLVTIVISSPEAAKEVLKDHDVNFADRDPPDVAMVATYGGLDIIFAPYGDHWRMMRKVCIRELFNQGSLKAVYGLRRTEVRGMVNRIQSKVGSPIDIGDTVLFTVFNMMTNMMWGNTLNGEEMHRVTTNFIEVSQRLVGLLGEANISDIFPVLARFDIQGKKRRMKKVNMWFDQIFEFVIGERRKMKDEDKQKKDFLQVLLDLIDQEDQKTPLTKTHLKALFMDITVGGTESTTRSVEFALAELLNQPEIMKKAKQELEEVVGLNNIVEETDLSRLPYLDAIVKEVFRLHPPGPLLVPRCPRESRTIGGYLIPKGSTIFVNVSAIQRDPKYWKQPLEFKPERFMESSVEWDYNGNDHRYFPFGSGRRICVAVSIADKTVAWLLGTLLHSFDWQLPEGVKLDLNEQFGLGLKKKIPLVAVPTVRYQ